MGSIKTISIIVAANIKGLETGLGKANKSLTKFASGAARMGSMMSFGITAPLTALGKSAFDTFSNFENSMAKVRAVTSASVDDFNKLTEEAKRLGRTTQFTAQQFSDLQLVLGRKGFNPNQIINMEGAIADLALATGEDLTLAADTVSSSINAFGLEASEAASVANTLAAASANSSIQLSTFSTAFGHAGASAKAVGVDINELAAMMGVLMDNGIKASKAGTGLRKIFMKLNEVGIPFSQTLKDIASGEMSLNDATKLVGATAANQLLILALQKEKVKELTWEYKTNTGALAEMVDLMGKTAKAKVNIMNSAIEGMKLEIGALLAEALLPLIHKITEWSLAFSNLSESTKKTIITIAGILAVIGPLLLTLAAIVAVMSPLAAAFTFFNGLIPFSIAGTSAFGIALGRLTMAGWSSTGALGAMAGAMRAVNLVIAANPIGAILIGITALIGLFWAFSEDVDEATTSLKDFEAPAASTTDRLADINKELDNIGKSRFGLLREELEGNIKPLKAEIDELNTAISSIDIDNANFSETAQFLSLELQLKSSKDKLNKYLLTLAKLNLKEFGDVERKVNTVVTTTTSSIDSVGDDEPILGTQLMDGLGDSQARVDAWDAETAALGRYGSALGLTALQAVNIKESIVALFSSFAQGFSELFEKQTKFVEINGVMEEVTVSFGEKFGNFMKEFLLGIAKMIIQTAILAALLSFTGLGGVGAGAGAKGFGDIFKNLIGGAYADGGQPPVGKISLVGERGPELFVPGSKGTIVPNHMMGGGSSTVIPDVRISGSDLIIVFDKARKQEGGVNA